MSVNLSQEFANARNNPLRWEKPGQYDLSQAKDQSAVEDLLRSGEVVRVLDPIESIAEDLFETHNPESLDDSAQKKEFVDDIVSKGMEFGEWFYFPWSGQLIRYPDQGDHFELRTNRNLNIITKEEQALLGATTIAAYGLSVGSNIVRSFVQSGIGNRYIIGDFDSLTPTNLNRISSSMAWVGSSKTDIIASYISEADPYIEQIHERDGYNARSRYILDDWKPDLIVEEVDNLSSKARVRNYASESGTPLIMVTDLGHRAIIDVERHDQEEVSPFLGKVPRALNDELISGNYTESQKKKATASIVGVRNLSSRMAWSAMEVGRSLSGNPQLGATALRGASIATVAAQEILLGRKLRSGSYRDSPASVLKIKRPDSLRQSLSIWRDFAKFIIGRH